MTGSPGWCTSPPWAPMRPRPSRASRKSSPDAALLPDRSRRRPGLAAPSGADYFCGDLPENKQQVVWATAYPPVRRAVRPTSPRRVEDQARPGTSWPTTTRPSTRSLSDPPPSGWAPPPTTSTAATSPCCPTRLRPRRHPRRRGSRLVPDPFLSPCSSTQVSRGSGEHVHGRCDTDAIITGFRSCPGW